MSPTSRDRCCPSSCCGSLILAIEVVLVTLAGCSSTAAILLSCQGRPSRWRDNGRYHAGQQRLCVEGARRVTAQQLLLNRRLHLLNDTVLVEEVYLTLGGVDVDVNIGGVDLQAEVGEAVRVLG